MFGFLSFAQKSFSNVTVGQIKEASASASVSSSVSVSVSIQYNSGASVSSSSLFSASARRVPLGSAMIYGTSTTTVNTTANGSRVRESNGTSSASATVLSSGLRIREGVSAASGLSSTSCNANIVVNASAQIAVSASNQASAVTVVDAVAQSSPSSSIAAECERARTAQCLISAASTNSINGRATFSSKFNDPAVSSNCLVTVAFERVRETGAIKSAESVLAVIGRKKWEPILLDGQTWEPILLDGQTWDTIEQSTQIWTEVA